MSEIHYFQRYSQKENMVTNNTLLLFSRLYRSSPDKFKNFINNIIQRNDTILNPVVIFTQQEKGEGSTPDGSITQESFKIVIETKLYSQHNPSQIKEHFNSFNKEQIKILLWINKEPISANYREEILDLISKSEKSDIKFASTTFNEICRVFKDSIQDYDIEMNDIIDDYEDFCISGRLIDNADSAMRVVLSSETLEQNLSNNMYYAPRSRGYHNHKYLGLYKNKAVAAIGELETIVDATYDLNNSELIIDSEQKGKITEEQKEIIKEAVMEAKKKFGYIISEGHRFFFVKKFYVMNFKKHSSGGLMGQKYFDLTEIEGYNKNMETSQIAELLDGKEWGKD